MEWFRLAAQQGHPKSSYNLAIGHLSGLKTKSNVQSNMQSNFKKVTEANIPNVNMQCEINVEMCVS